MDRKRRQLKEDIDNHTRNINKIETVIAELKSSNVDSVQAYHHNMSSILHAIDNERHWRDKPVGPLGKYGYGMKLTLILGIYVKVKDPKWTNVLESVIGNMLGDFMVTNREDRSILESILRKYKAYAFQIAVIDLFLRTSVRIHQSKPELFDYSHGEPDDRFLTILRCLEVEI